MALCGTISAEETERKKVEIWQFEDHFYLEYQGHLYVIGKIEHSINCNCRE